MKFSRLVFLAAVALPLTANADTARGTVFEDHNANSVRDAGEPGIANVRVSNGVDVVLTDGEGAYQLDVDDEAIVFITKPAGYATPVSADQLPQFYYVHQPAGSPAGLRYTGIAPTGPLPDRIDFALTKVTEPAAFDAVLFADTQPQTNAELDYIRDDVVADLLTTDARFGMTMGDILFDDMSMFPRFNALIAQIGIPWYNVPGNHELNLKARSDRHSLETFKRFFGPPYYAFEVGEALFVVLDNIYYKGNGESDPGDVRGNGGYDWKFTQDQLTWLGNELRHVRQEKLVFLAMHAPLGTYPRQSGQPGAEVSNRRALFKLLEGRPNLYAVAGHTHTTEHHYYGREDGFRGPGQLHHHVLATVSGSWWSGPFDERGVAVAEQWDGTPNGYHVLSVDGTDLSVRYQAAGESSDYQMRIIFDVAHHGLRADGLRDFRMGELTDGRMSADEVAAAEIIVNLFDGGPRSTAAFAINDGEFLPMQRVFRADPHTNELMIRNRDTTKSWVTAIPSSHLFSADLPDPLEAGTYTVTVRAVDEFGRTHHGHRVLEIGR
jgi:hypothetical protein